MKIIVLFVGAVTAICTAFENTGSLFKSPPSLKVNVEGTYITTYERIKYRASCAVICSTDDDCFSFQYSEEDRTCNISNGLPPWITHNTFGKSCNSYKNYMYEPTLDLCYRIESQTLLPYEDAEVACATEGGHLVRIRGEKMNSFLVATVVGYNTTDNGYFIDGVAHKEEGYVWKFSDDQNITWFNWATGAPNKKGEVSGVALQKTSEFAWNDFKHGQFVKAIGYICEIDRAFTGF